MSPTVYLGLIFLYQDVEGKIKKEMCHKLSVTENVPGAQHIPVIVPASCNSANWGGEQIKQYMKTLISSASLHFVKISTVT